MNSNTELLLGTRCVIKFYEAVQKDVCRKYGLTSVEAEILAFLHNNPGLDTANDIVRLRMFQKGNVSQAIEHLIQKKLLVKTQDKTDRRRNHLAPSEDASKIIEEILSQRQVFRERLFQGFTREEISQFIRLNEKIFENAEKGLKER